MKRILKHLVLGAAAVGLLAIPSLAADFTHCADYLNDLGLFRGTTSGYDLNRAPTRMEAGVMLVRLLGAEEEALANKDYTAPFTDVPDWAKPYAQYLYDEGLTNGVTATLYGYSRTCTAQQYTTFLLRALGYSDAEGGDFTYANALDYGREIGLVDEMNCNEKTFLRDNVAAMSFTALSVQPKTGETDLLTKLVKDGAIAKADAESYLDFFADYRDYTAAVTKANTDSSSMAADMQMQMGITLAGMDFMTADMDVKMAMEANLEHMDQTKLSYDMKMAMEVDPTMAAAMGMPADQTSMVQNMQCWYTNGYYYMNDGTSKLKMPLSYEEVLAQLPTTDLTAGTTQLEPLCAFTSLVKNHNSDGTTSYTVNYATAAFNSLLDSILSTVPTETGDPASVTVNAMDAEIFFRGDRLSSMDMLMDMTTVVEGYDMGISMVMSVDNIKTGSTVKVSLPSDLNTYQEIIGGVNVPAATK